MKKILAFTILVLLAACGRANPTAVPLLSTAPSTPLFQNISRAAGITQTRQGNDRAIGQAWGDYDRDGWVDFYVTDTKGPNTLFRNNGDGTFSRSPLAEAVALPEGFSGGASFADYNNDGWLDLYVVNWGQNVLFRNDEGQGFTDVTTEAGVGGKEDNSQTASWGDYNSDGWLDLYVANWACYPRCGRPNQGDSDRLYHNNGDGTFTEVTRLLGGGTFGAGFVASFTDFDNDGDQDIYLVNDEFLFPIGNKLWRNDGPGCDDESPLGHCFTEISADAGANTRVMGMGLATADYDNDGNIDFYFTNAGPMPLLQNQGDGTFANVAQQAGVDAPNAIAWAAAAFDYNNDGWQDLYLAVMTTTNHKGLAANPLFHNNGDGTFSRVSSGSGAGDVGPTMGIALADFDNDGWVDLLLGNKDEGYSLLRNQAGMQFGHHWLTLELVGAGPVNRDAVGSRVTVRTADGNTQMREVQNGSSLGAGHELRLHFGLGAFDTVEEMTIRWPDGRSQTFTQIPANRQISLPYPLDAAAAAAQQAVLYPATEQPATSPLATNQLTIHSLIAANAVAWLGLFLLILRTRRQLGVARRTVQWVGALVLVGVTAVYLFTTLQAAEKEPPPRQTEPTLAERMAQAGAVLPLQLPAATKAEVELGRALFWDPILSGNKDTACVTCHHPNEGTGDGLALPIGTGGQGLGPERVFVSTRQVLVPRNATPIYNLGLDGMDVMFWDGRVSALPGNQFDSPANDDMPYTLTNAIAVQAMFPVTSQDEMRGHPGDVDVFGERNPFGAISGYRFTTMWEGLLAQVLAVPAYQELFQAAYPEVPLDKLHFAHAANALAAYQMDTFTFLDSPWDRYLQGEKTALSPEALAGAELFYGQAGCADCHSGALLSDLQFHNIGVPQVGPGKGNEEPFDFGRARETGDDSDLFAFRTPPLRNVAITGPWMHNGAYATLEAVIQHHLNARDAVENYDYSQLSPLMQAEDSGDTAVHTAALNAPSFAMPTRDLTDAEVAALIAFLEALTSPTATDLSHVIPDAVPSGLPVGGTID